MKKIIIILGLIISSSMSFAQDTTVVSDSLKVEKERKFTASIDIVYPYLWRGIRYYGDKIATQANLNYAITSKLTIGLWGSTNFQSNDKAYQEFDWNVSYQVCPVLKLMLSDYYFPATKNNLDWERSNYFDYSEGSAHSLDFSILLDYTDKGFPLDFQWNTLVGGNDFKIDKTVEVLNADTGENETVVLSTKRAFSSYAEVGYTYNVKKINVDIRPFVGATIINGGYYGADANGKSGFSFTNVGVQMTKEINITKNYSIPIFIKYSNNDYGIQNFDDFGNLTKTTRNFFSAGLNITIR